MNTNVNEKEEIVVGDVVSGISLPAVNSDTDIEKIAYKEALEQYPEDVKAEIIALADQIDVTQLEKVMSYGEAPLLRSFEEAGALLKAEEGSSVDQAVIKQVIELSKKANESYEDFNLVLQEPNFFEKLLLKISKSRSEKKNAEIKTKAITNYKLLVSLRDSCEDWLEMLKEGMFQITSASTSDKLNRAELEKYIVAGRLAQERIAGELETAKSEYEISKIQETEEKYNALKEGAEIFDIVLLNLEKSRAAFIISITQLALEESANKNLQIAIKTQKNNSMAVTSQQLRNAVLDAKNKQVMEGQKSIAKLNDDLMKMVATNAVLTAEESEKVLLNGIYSVEEAAKAAKTVIDGCALIQKARENNTVNMKQQIEKLRTIVDDLEPYISKVKGNNTDANKAFSSSGAKSIATSKDKGLKF